MTDKPTPDPALIEELNRFAMLHNDELAELNIILYSLSGYRPYFLSPEFESALDKEVQAQLTNYRTCAKIVTETKTHTWEEESLEWVDV